MCRIILLIILLWIFGLSIAITVAAVYGPVWSIPLVILGYLLLSALLLRAGFKQLLLLPFRLKGRVLRGATIQLHGIERGTRPVRETKALESADHEVSPDKQESSGSQEPTQQEPAQSEVRRREPTPDRPDDRDYFWIDLTIRPAADSSGTFKLWEPSELVLMPAAQKITLKEDGENPPVYEVQLWNENEGGGGWAKDDANKYQGMQRVRLLFGVPPAHPRHVKLRYYLEFFGDLQLPEGAIRQNP